MKRLCTWIVVALVAGSCRGPSAPDPVTPLVIISASGQLAAGYDLLVNTDRGRTDWLTLTGDGLQASYPSGQAWGFVGAALQGNPNPGSRPSKDLSAYKTLSIQLRGAAGGESVEVGIKDNTDPDSGTETKKTVTLTTAWQPYTFNLPDFSTADRKQMYLVFELVFNGAPARR